MKNRKPFIQLLIIAGLLFGAAACDKTDDPSGDSPGVGTVKDADGNVYKTVKIGTQVWLAEDLKTTKYNDGTPIPNVTDNETWAGLSTGAYCNYDNLESRGASYGRLYNWYAVNTGMLACVGWHVPTDEDWTILENYLIANGYNYDGSENNNKIAKSLASTTGWELSDFSGTPGANPEKNNSTMFTALPFGRRDRDGEFDLIGKNGYWWSSTSSSIDENAYLRFLGYNGYSLNFLGTVKESGFSVRLVRD
jgi:uncharacterized protein (TIGR02145 family)